MLSFLQFSRFPVYRLVAPTPTEIAPEISENSRRVLRTMFAFAQLRAETSENHTRRRQKRHGNAESDVFGLLAGHRFDQQGEKATRRFEEHFNM